MSQSTQDTDDINEQEQIDNSDTDSESETESNQSNTGISLELELGDIIEIVAPSNFNIHENTFFISYIDEDKMKLINVSTTDFIQLNFNGSGGLTDESITAINLLSRSDVEGYARQNNYLSKTWIDVYFGGEIPITITGEITNLEEDMIEITTYPDLKIVYIDFGYKGIPEDIPIDKIVIREKPLGLKNKESLSQIREDIASSEIGQEIGEQSPNVIEYFDDGEYVITMPEDAVADENIKDALQTLYVAEKGIIFGEYLDEVNEIIEIPESQKRYSIDAQITSFMDELLSTIPNAQRSNIVIKKVTTLVERFRELRDVFSVFDDNGNVRTLIQNNPTTYKPLVDHIKNLDTKLSWLIPVVSLKKKIYDFCDNTDGDDDGVCNISDDITNEKLFENLQMEENIKNNTYYKNKSKVDENKYSNMHQQMNYFMTPYENPKNANTDFLISKRVNTDIEAIIENIDDFYSIVYGNLQKKADLIKRRFVIQKYNLGIDRVVLDKKTNNKVTLIPSDKMTIKSLITLPKPAIQFSKIHLPGTSLIDKTRLHQNYLMLFRSLRTKTNVFSEIIDDLTHDIDYEKLEEKTKQDFLSVIREFVLSDTISIDDQNEKFDNFLNVVIPKTRTIIRLVQKYSNNKLSFFDVVQQLEPFMIYSKDVSYKQYLEIRFFLKEKIAEFKNNTETRRIDFSKLKNARYDESQYVLVLLQILSQNNDIMNLFLTGYRFPGKEILEKKMTSHEILEKIITIDQGVLLTKLMATMMSSLMTPNNLMDSLSPIEDMGDNEKIKADDCVKRIITKRYTSVDQMQKDKRRDDVFYDKEFDKTPYSIIDKYEDAEKKMIPEKFSSFLVENLIQKHDCPKNSAKELATILIARKKRIKEGEYAILEIKPKLRKEFDESKLSDMEREEVEEEGNIKAKIYYYKRLKNDWIEDKEVGEESFIDSSDLLCNLSTKCYNKTISNLDNGCESVVDTKNRMMEISRNKTMKEFDRRYEISAEEMKKTLEKTIIYHIKHIFRLTNLKEIQNQKQNNLTYALGNQVADIADLVQSPYLKLRDLILGQDDFDKKQADIVSFYEKYCREPMILDKKDDPNWKYCLKTNTKLLPGFLYTLAYTYIIRGNSNDFAMNEYDTNENTYQQKLNEICATHGLLSDDGDSIVDKHSGFVIRKIDFANEEGFDEAGFRIITNSVIQQDIGQQVLENLNKKDRVFETTESEEIYVIFKAITKNIGIPPTEIEELALRISLQIFNENIKSEIEYNKYAEKVEQKTGKKVLPYLKKRNRTAILIVASVILVTIQTMQPSFKTTKTNPGCVRSFSGFPLSGMDDQSGIKYIACVIDQLKTTYEPWNSIDKMGSQMLSEQLRYLMESVILKNTEIDNLYLQKRNYLNLNPDPMGDVHSIEKWQQFHPPLFETNVIKSLQNVSSAFENDFMELMRKGNKDQNKNILVFKSKIYYYSTAIIEAVQKIVETKELGLKTRSNKPFLQNTCCNESGKSHLSPIQYFEDENESIRRYVLTVSALSKIVKKANRFAKAQILFHPFSTYLKVPSIINGFLTGNVGGEIDGSYQNRLVENVYLAFIHYCKLDKDLPIHEVFHGFFKEIPQGYESNKSLIYKIEFLKRNGHKFGVENLHQLMQIINKRNIIQSNQKQKYLPVEVLKDIVNVFEKDDSKIMPDALRQRLLDVLNSFVPNQWTNPDSNSPNIKDIDQLKNYLAKANQDLYNKITKFLKKYAKLNKNDNDKLEDFLCKIHMWKMDEESNDFNFVCKDKTLGQSTDSPENKYYDNALFTISKFMKNAVFDMTKIFPNRLLNAVENIRIHSYWNLSDFDKADLYNNITHYFGSLTEFNQDAVLLKILKDIPIRLMNLQLFVSNLTVYNPIKKSFLLFDKRAYYLILVYCFFMVMNEYIELSMDDNMLQSDINEKKKSRIEQIIEAEDIALQFDTQLPEINENMDDNNDVMREMQINVGNKQDLQERVAKLLMAYLNIIKENKSIIDIRYSDIQSVIREKKELEKKRITDRLKVMDEDERSVETLKKKHKLENWNVGMQKGLVVYDKKTSDRERQEIEEQEQERQGTQFIDIQDAVENSELMDDVEDIQNRENEEDEIERENESNDFSGLGKNYMDGAYYDEDGSDDDFGEDN